MKERSQVNEEKEEIYDGVKKQDGGDDIHVEDESSRTFFKILGKCEEKK